MGIDGLGQRRQDAADLVLEGYDFGYEVVGGQGWERTTADDEWVKVLYFADDESPGADSLKGHLAIRFNHGTDEVGDAWAVVAGQPAGNPGSPLPSPGR